MKFPNLLLVVCFFTPGLSYSQYYFNEVHNIDDNSILVNGLIANNDRILVSYSYVNPSTLLEGTGIFERKSNDISRIEFEDFNSSRQALLGLNNNILLMHETLPSSNTEVGFKVLDQDLSEKNEFSYSLSGMNGGNVSSTTTEQHIFLANANFLTSNQWETNLIKVDGNGETEWNIYLEDSVGRIFPRDIEMCKNGDIIVSTSQGSALLNGKLHRITPAGDVLWENTTESESSGTIQFYAIELSNGNIVQSTELDIPIFGQYRYPPVLSWFDSDGLFIQDTVFKTTPGNHILTIQGLTLGNGDYFFAHGTEETGGDNTIKYGWIMKISNEGEVIWNKLYRKNDLPADRFHFIEYLEELESGDIVTSGRVRDENGKWRIWIMRINENGCFGSSDCGDIVSSTLDPPKINKWKVFPNPSSHIINLPNYSGEMNFRIVDAEGKNYKVNLLSENRIKISGLTSGMYYLLIIKDRQVVGKSGFIRQ